MSTLNSSDITPSDAPESATASATASGTQFLYWEYARTPFASAMFLLPLLIFYEWSVFSVPDQELTNGAHQWVRTVMVNFGLNDLMVSVALFLGLVVWHYWSKLSFRLHYETLLGMWSESILFALLLIFMGQAQHLAMIEHPATDVPQIGQQFQQIFLTVYHPVTPPKQQLICYMGAGIYEELIFRLMMIPVCFYLLRLIFIPRLVSATLAVLTSGLLFAVAHEVTLADATVPLNELPTAVWGQIHSSDLRLFVFAFRWLAGVFFGVLFLLRGFGIAVGCHLIYDIFVGIMMQPESN
jgi:hypothetical protein